MQKNTVKPRSHSWIVIKADYYKNVHSGGFTTTSHSRGLGHHLIPVGLLFEEINIRGEKECCVHIRRSDSLSKIFSQMRSSLWHGL